MEFIHNCWGSNVELGPAFYYPYGNTLMEDYLEDFVLDEEIDILLLGCGDIRHILNTVGGFFHRFKEAKINTPKNVKFVVTDVDVSLIARNLLLLEIIKEIDASKLEDLDFLWDVWYNKFILLEHRKRLEDSISKFLDFLKSSEDVPTKSLWKFGDDKVCEKVAKVLQYWKHPRQIQGSDLTIIAVSQPPNLYKDRGVLVTSGPTTSYFEEYQQFTFSQTARDPKAKNEPEIANPTMYRPGENMYCVPADVQPWLSYYPKDCKPEVEQTTLYEATIHSLQHVIINFKAALKKTKISIEFWTEEALSFCYLTLQPQGQIFQLIHTSNLADSYYAGVINVLLACQPLLKHDRSILITELFRWSPFYPSLEMYLRENVCCDALLLPTMFGLRLAEDFQLGTTSIHTMPQIYHLKETCVQKIRWVKASTTNILVDIKESPDVRRTLKNLLKLSLKYGNSTKLNANKGICTYSPMTLMQLLHQMQDRVQGGMTSLLLFVDKILGDSVVGKYQQNITWKMLKEIYSDNTNRDDLIQINVSFPLFWKLINEGKTTIIIDNRGLNYEGKLILEIPEEHFSEIISIFKFNKADFSFTFPLLRTQWDSISDQAKIFIVVGGEKTYEYSEKILLKEKAKIIGTLGFNEMITSKKLSCEKCKTCTEYIDRYEMTFKSGVKEKLSTVEKFLPKNKIEKCEVVLTVTHKISGDTEKHVLRFPCCLDKSKSKFSTNNKEGTVTAVLVKHKTLNIGKSVLPLRMINDKLDLKTRTSSELNDYLKESDLKELMFDFPVDHQINEIYKMGHKVEDPFWNLRFVILQILQETAKPTGVSNLVGILLK